MWTRAQIKSNARHALDGRYGQALTVTILAGLLANSLSTIYNFTNLLKPSRSYSGISDLFSVWTLVIILFGVFFGNIILVGMCRFFVRNHYDDGQVNHLFDGFRLGYVSIMGSMFTTRLIISFYTFFLIIPGIVAGYQYCLVPYLLSENPNMSGAHARELSKRMTNGEKWNIFVLDLSFLGWYLIGFLCFIIGVIFIIPYPEAARAELYLFLRDRQDITISSTIEGSGGDVPMES